MIKEAKYMSKLRVFSYSVSEYETKNCLNGKQQLK